MKNIPNYKNWTLNFGNKVAKVGDNLYGILLNKNCSTSISWLSDRYVRSGGDIGDCILHSTITQGTRAEKELSDIKDDERVFVVYRDPISRFKSFVANNIKTRRGQHLARHYDMRSWSISRIIDIIEEEFNTNISIQDRHIRKQSDFYSEDQVKFIVPIELFPEFLKSHGIEPIEAMNKTPEYNIVLSDTEKKRLSELYAADYEILKSPKLWKRDM